MVLLQRESHVAVIDFALRPRRPTRDSSQGLGSFIGGLISYGTGHIDAGPNIPNWIWIFVINGTMTIGVGVVFLWICPEQAETAWFLTPHERAVGKERVRGNMSSLESKVWKWDGMAEALLPWRDMQGWIRESAFERSSNMHVTDPCDTRFGTSLPARHIVLHP